MTQTKIAVIINPLPKTNLSPARSVGKLLTILPKESEILFFGIGYNESLLPKLGPTFQPVLFKQNRNKSDFLKKQKYICEQLEESKPDIVLFWIADKMFKVMRFCKRNNIPTIMWVYGNTFDFIKNRLKRFISRTIFIKMLKDATYIAEEHPGVMQLLKSIDDNNRFTSKIKFPYLSIYCDFPSLSMSKNNKEKKRKFMVISRLAKEKNINLIIEAFLNLFKNNDGILLEIIGSGPLENELKAQFVDEKNVIFSGWKDKNYVANALFDSDYYILASSSEGFPSTIQEAIISKALVIAFPVGGLTSFLSEENSVIIDRLTVDSVEQSIKKAFAMDVQRKEKLISNAINDLQKDFSLSACANKMKQALEYAIEQKE